MTDEEAGDGLQASTNHVPAPQLDGRRLADDDDSQELTVPGAGAAPTT